jgi:hypothetical protein
MTRVKDRLGKSVRLGVVLSIAGMVGASACGSDDSGGPPTSRGGRGGTGNPDSSAGTNGFGGSFGASGAQGASGATGASGASGASGAAGTAGATGTGGTGGTADASVCPGPSSVPVDGFPVCPDSVRCVTVTTAAPADAGADAAPTTQQVCVAARCVPSSAIPNPDQVALLPDCPDPAGTKCVPEPYIATLGQFLAKECRSLINAEGRCIPVMLPAVKAQIDRLPQADCASDERCAPCYDPTTAASTGACNAGCGPGPKEQPKTFATCCSGIGSCVPASLAGADASRLGKDNCTDAGFLCAPKAFTDAAYVPPTCRSVGNAEGRCLPDCLPDIAAQASLLPRSTCAEHHLCAPCFDPLKSTPSAPVSTGACNRGTDTPKEPPTIFPNCCGNLGVCVPKSAVPAAQQAQLGKDTCATDGGAGADVLCAPRFLTDPTAKPATCRSLNDNEGRCLPACLPAVSSQPGLEKGTCQDGFLCAPCHNPVTSVATGACGINGDMPAEPAKPFPRCCTGDSGACVPLSLIPDAQESLLGRDNNKCATGTLCVPTELADSTFKPPACNSLGGGEGRCLAPCIPQIAAQASRLPQSTCPANRVCAPCYDPTITPATPSGACSINGDAPTRPPYTFPKCCAYNGANRGTCIPLSVAGPIASGLTQDTCPGPDSGTDAVKCVPDQKVRDQNYKFPSCRAAACILGICAPRVDGACVPDCVPDPGIRGIIDRDTCAAGELCAPCVNPLTQARTGACD